MANVTLEMYYTSNGFNSNPAWVVIGNPVVLSSTDYTIYADGKNDKESFVNIQLTQTYAGDSLKQFTSVTCFLFGVVRYHNNAWVFNGNLCFRGDTSNAENTINKCFGGWTFPSTTTSASVCTIRLGCGIWYDNCSGFYSVKDVSNSGFKAESAVDYLVDKVLNSEACFTPVPLMLMGTGNDISA